MSDSPAFASSPVISPNQTPRHSISFSSVAFLKPKSMLKLWPSSGAADGQTTPKSSDRQNPFEIPRSLAHTSPSSSTSSGTRTPIVSTALHPLHHHLLNTHITPSSSDQAPSPLTPPPTVTSFAPAVPPQLSTAPPDFNIQQPPPLRRQQTATPSNPSPTAPATATTTNGATSSSTPTPSPSKGQIHVKLIQARGLNVESMQSQPYVVVQFEQNEFVSREPITESGKEAKGVPGPLSRTNSSNALGTLGASGITRAFEAAAARLRNTTGPPAASSSGASGSGALTPGLFGPISPHNPVWKHQVSFDVTSEQSYITFSIYDRHAGDGEGFIGMLEVKPVLVHDRTVDQWLRLKPRENETVSGEIRIQITFEQYKTKRALTPRDFEFMKLIGRGTFGRVFQVRKKDTKRIYAMKVLSKKEIVAKKEVAHTIGERKILQRSLECPFLVGLKFSFQTDTELYLVTDFKSGGELFWHLQKETRFSEERARFYIAELVLALEHLHKYDIVYRDLKPENILLDATGHVALCDFGLSKPDLPADQLTNTFCGTTEYLAPEVLLDDHGYSKLVDFWSLGVLLFEMCCGWSPFYAEDTQQMYKNICFGKIRFPKGVIGEDGKQFVKGLLNRNPRHRLGALHDAAELKQHPFFKSIDWRALSLKQVTPPFKPNVESDESTANFDPEFTSADVRESGIDAFAFDEEDPSESWAASFGVTNGSTHSFHGPSGGIGSAMEIKKTGAKKANGANGAGGRGISPLTSSVQENFRGFTYQGESMIQHAAGLLGEDRKNGGDEEAVDDDDGEERVNGGNESGTEDEWEDEVVYHDGGPPMMRQMHVGDVIMDDEND